MSQCVIIIAKIFGGIVSQEAKSVTIYSTPTCAYCKMAKQYFKENNIQYKEVDVATDEAAAEEMVAKTGHVGVPQIFIGNEVVIGFDKPTLDQLLGVKS